MKRRDFIAFVGSMAGICRLGPSAAASATPIVGVIGESLPGKVVRLPAIRRGLKDGGYVEGQNVLIDNRWGNGNYDQLSQIVTDFVRRQVAVIITTGGSALARTVKTATATIPVIFTIGDDPVQLGLVDSLSHPGGNMTGFSLYTTELMAKRLELLHEMVPHAGTVALLVDAGPDTTPLLSRQQTERAANTLGLKILGFKVGSMSDFEAALAAAVQQGAQALVLAAAPFFTGQNAQIIALAARYRLPAIYPWREFINDGGLMSYGPDVAEIYRQVGRYAGRILDGTAPRELPVQLPTKFELIINLKTAKTLGLTFPRLLSAWADHVIE